MRLVLLALSLLLIHCGESRLRGSRIECYDDMQCPVGELCLEDAGECVLYDPQDPLQSPKPATSQELLERMGPQAFTVPDDAADDAPALLTMDLVVLDQYRVRLSHRLAGGSVRARVDDDGLVLWNLRLAADGGGMSVVDAAGQPIEVYMTDLVLEAPEEARGALTVGEYPESQMATETPMTLRAKVGGAPDSLASINLTVERAALAVHFDLDGQTLVVDLGFSGSWAPEGAEGFLRIESLSVSAHLAGAVVPAHWAAPR